jgi:hypothetical protein
MVSVPPLPRRSLLDEDAPRPGKRKPWARLRAAEEGAGPVADWASRHGDLARSTKAPGAQVEWRVHDRTHVEFAIDYAFGGESREHTWEAFFFVPESFHLDDDTYDKRAIYDDLWSYVRYAVPPVPFGTLASLAPGSPLARLSDALAVAAGRENGSPEVRQALRRLRHWACLLRASGLSALRALEAPPEHDRGQVAAFLATCVAVGATLRAVLARAERTQLVDEVAVAARWIDEDISLVLETLCATLGLSLEELGEHADLAARLAACAVAEARHRRNRGYDSVGSGAADERSAEHFEFRRHMLKRFTASVLWLSLEVRQAPTWVVHALYGVAAGAAMAFALAANLRAPDASASFARYAVILVVAYALKDRLKALLQGAFAGWAGRRLPDRRWALYDREHARCVGEVRERAGFAPFRQVPPEVLVSRRATRTHPLEEGARPERVLWHKKTVVTKPVQPGDADFTMITEIFRLNLHRWLRHADDPKRTIAFADPDEARVYQATTRRVYNINIVYRLGSSGARAAAPETPWRRIRVVVSRRGIERIDAISS